jgi:hypothetical protein
MNSLMLKLLIRIDVYMAHISNIILLLNLVCTVYNHWIVSEGTFRLSFFDALLMVKEAYMLYMS